MPGMDRIDCVEMGLAPLYVALRQNGHLYIQHMQIVRVKAQNSEQIRLTFKGIRTSFGDPSFSSSCCDSSLVTLTTLSLLLSKVTSWTSSVLYKTINITLLLTPMSVCVCDMCVSLCLCTLGRILACTEMHGKRVVNKSVVSYWREPTTNPQVEHLLFCVEKLLERLEITQYIRSFTKLLNPKAYFRLRYHKSCCG